MGILAQMLAETGKREQHWIVTVLLVAAAITVIVRGVLAVRNKHLRVRYVIVKEGGTAVAFGVLFVVAGLVFIAITIIEKVSGPLF